MAFSSIFDHSVVAEIDEIRYHWDQGGTAKCHPGQSHNPFMAYIIVSCGFAPD
jgi:hypothetical protein